MDGLITNVNNYINYLFFSDLCYYAEEWGRSAYSKLLFLGQLNRW